MRHLLVLPHPESFECPVLALDACPHEGPAPRVLPSIASPTQLHAIVGTSLLLKSNTSHLNDLDFYCLLYTVPHSILKFPPAMVSLASSCDFLFSAFVEYHWDTLFCSLAILPLFHQYRLLEDSVVWVWHLLSLYLAPPWTSAYAYPVVSPRFHRYFISSSPLLKLICKPFSYQKFTFFFGLLEPWSVQAKLLMVSFPNPLFCFIFSSPSWLRANHFSGWQHLPLAPKPSLAHLRLERLCETEVIVRLPLCSVSALPLASSWAAGRGMWRGPLQSQLYLYFCLNFLPLNSALCSFLLFFSPLKTLVFPNALSISDNKSSLSLDSPHSLPISHFTPLPSESLSSWAQAYDISDFLILISPPVSTTQKFCFWCWAIWLTFFRYSIHLRIPFQIWYPKTFIVICLS